MKIMNNHSKLFGAEVKKDVNFSRVPITEENGIRKPFLMSA